MGIYKDRVLAVRGSLGMPRHERCAQRKARGEYRRAERQTDATLRQEQRDRIGDDAQLRRLDERFGKGKGAKRERARLIERSRNAA